MDPILEVNNLENEVTDRISNLILEENKLENEVTDRISNLPDSILCKILSFLPTKDAIATCILSTRWKNVFPFRVLPISLDLDDSNLLHVKETETETEPDTPSRSFINFVDKLLNVTLAEVPRVKYMRLYCYKSYGDAKVLSWVSAALRLKLWHLELKCSLNEPESLFRCLNGCRTLVKLSLFLDCRLSVPDNFKLPKLRKLKLLKLSFDDSKGGSLNDMIAGCPALERLELYVCSLGVSENLYIHAPRLKWLGICNYIESRYHLNIDAPKLQMLVYTDYAARSYCLSNVKSLLAAHIDVGPSNKQFEDMLSDYNVNNDMDGAWYVDEGIGKLVTACSSTFMLHLAACSIEALQWSRVQLPEFPNLVTLSLGSLGCYGWIILARLLWLAPNLTELNFEEGFAETEDGYANFLRVALFPVGPKQPPCLELHMKKIKFHVFDGKADELKLLRFLLDFGKVLEKTTLYCLPSINTRIVKKLLKLPTHSKIVLKPRETTDVCKQE